MMHFLPEQTQSDDIGAIDVSIDAIIKGIGAI
jgi:hypothetical protein